MTTLTDRYIWAVVRAVPVQQRADIERELRASIEDDIEGRGGDEKAAERETLLALGDPDRLAASYAQRPHVLIGPRYYFDYLRLLKVLYLIVLPITVVAVILGQVIAGDGIGHVIGTTVTVAITTAVHFGFWPTLVFAMIERSGQKEPLIEWKLESLPELPDRRARTGLAELIAVPFLLLFAGALVWQQFFSVFTDAAGEAIPLLQPELWSFWLPYTLAILAAEIIFCVVLYRLHRWTWAMAGINVALNLAFVIPAVGLVLERRVFNPEFIEQLGWPDAHAPVLAPIIAVVLVGFAVADAADGIVKARKAARQ